MKTKENGTHEKARAYVRVSTLKESQKDSPEHQEAFIRETAQREGVNIEHVYLDKDTGTSIIAREDVQRMVNDAKAGQFNAIYFTALSRFSRDTLDAISLKRILVNALGVRVISIEDNYDSGKEDNEMLFGIISSMNQKQSENISTSSKRGIRQSAKKGNFTGSIPPYGYRKVNADGRKTLEVIPDQAETVQTIFELYTKGGLGEKAITNYLNEDKGVPSQKGGAWGLTSVQRILQNETYTGYVTFCKHETAQVYEDLTDLQNRKKKQVMRDREQWEKSDFQTHEAIISAEIYTEAQRVREVRGGGKRGGRRAFVNVFAKMIFCKECGAAMVVMTSISGSKSKKRYQYLICSKRRRQGDAGCKNDSWIPYVDFRDELIAGIVAKMKLVFSSDAVAEKLAFPMQDFEKELKLLDKTIQGNRKLLMEIRRQHMLGDITASQYEFEKGQYEAEIEEAEKRLANLNKKVNDRQDRERLIVDVRQALERIAVLDLNDVDSTRIVLSKLIDRIEISNDGEADVYTVLGQV